MSLCHLRLIQTTEDSSEAAYRVESPDFDEGKEWKEIGQLRIQKTLGSYEFSPTGPWLNHRVIPPWVFGLSEDAREKLLQADYNKHGCGAWTMTIHHYASTFLKEKSYPPKHPEVFFVGENS